MSADALSRYPCPQCKLQEGSPSQIVPVANDCSPNHVAACSVQCQDLHSETAVAQLVLNMEEGIFDQMIT